MSSTITHCPTDACAADCCVAAIISLADAAGCCASQHACHKDEGNQPQCVLCKEAFDLTIQAMQKHIECLKNCCK